MRGWVLGLAALGCAGCDVTGTSGLPDAGPSAAATEHLLRVSRFGSGSGFVRSEPEGIVCAPECEARFSAGSTVVLTAEPSPGSSFVGWGGECEGSTPVCEIEMGNTRLVSVQFYGPAGGDAGVSFDGGVTPPGDSGLPIDAGVGDGAVLDAAPEDGGVDGGVMDAGVMDAG